MSRRLMHGEAEDVYLRNLGLWLEDHADPESTGYNYDTTPVIFLVNARLLREAWAFLELKCESPIERLLAAELLFLTDGYNQVIYGGDRENPPNGNFATLLQTQLPIEGFRADFVLTCCFGANHHRVIVECDGHEFHERTKEQAKRDRSRDRVMTAAGHTVLRFTGSEIYADPKACAEQVAQIVTQRVDALLIEAGKIPRRGK